MSGGQRKSAFNPGLRRAASAFRHGVVAGRDARPTPEFDAEHTDGAGAGHDAPAAIGRLGDAVGALMRVPESLRYFARGYRYAQAIEPPPPTDAPAEASVPNALEAYFDAHAAGPGIWKWRHYFEIYDRHLARFRGRPVRMLEIGVFGGGSLAMWHEYFGPDTYIYGVDIDPSCRELAGPGVEILIGDQSDPAFWKSFLETEPAIDVVLDDGGHTAVQQMVTLECLLPAIRPGGVYICEDINGAFQRFHAFVDGLTYPLSAVGFGRQRPRTPLQQHVASVHRYPLVTVIEKQGSSRPAFESVRHGSEWPAMRTSAGV